MRSQKVKYQKIPRKRLPNIRREIKKDPQISFFSRISNSFHLLESHHAKEQVQQGKISKNSFNYASVSQRLKKLAHPRQIKKKQRQIDPSKPTNRSKSSYAKQLKSEVQQEPQMLLASSLGAGNNQLPVIQSQMSLKKSEQTQIDQQEKYESIQTKNEEIARQQEPQLLESLKAYDSLFPKYQDYHRKLMMKNPIYKEKIVKIVHQADWK